MEKPEELKMADLRGDEFTLDTTLHLNNIKVLCIDGHMFSNIKAVRRIAAKLNQIADWMEQKS